MRVLVVEDDITMAAFVLLYPAVSSGIEKRTDHSLLAELKELSSLMSLKKSIAKFTRPHFDACKKNGIDSAIF